MYIVDYFVTAGCAYTLRVCSHIIMSCCMYYIIKGQRLRQETLC
jgi:hypothetical protein